MLSQVHVESRQLNSWPVPISSPNNSRKSIGAQSAGLLSVLAEATTLLPDTASAQVYARGLEFVARPGTSDTLQTTITAGMRNSGHKPEGFCGCMVLFSEHEARLVTVITLWTGENAIARCDEESERLAELIQPYVDRWLRARSFNSFLSTP